MATSPSAKKPAQSAPFAWVIIVVGLAASMGWVLFGQKLGDTINVEDVAAFMAIYYGLLFVPLIVLALVLGYLDHRSVVRLGEARGRWALIGLAMGTGGFLVTIGYAWLNGGVVAGVEVPAGIGMIMVGLLLIMLQVATEEVLFRGWLQPALTERIGVNLGIALGAVLFATFHLTAGVRAPLSLVNLVLGGVLFGLLAQRSGGLIAPIAAHFAWNSIEDLGFGLVPNPSTGPLGALADYDLMGATLWGGHEEGLNASIGTTLVLLALIIPLLRSRAKA